MTADPQRWGLATLLFALPWCAFLLLLRAFPRPATELGQGVHPFWAPILLAWTALTLHFGWQKAAAPAALVDPVLFELSLLIPSLAASALLANRVRKVFPTFFWLAVFVSLARLPVAIWGTLATQRELGTSLDVHSVTRFANPFAQTAMKVAPGSNEQLGWLVWGPNLLILPGLYMLSLFGIAFAVIMWVIHAPRRRAEQTGA